MSKADKKTAEQTKAKDKEDHDLTQELEATFPASDPPASTQPGSGITGPEAAKRQ